jgi:glycosyltransferase involved in cell wall biosynthesis
MEPLISILIPAFNAEHWIAETLRSALGQTWQRKEIIVVDDGSTDQTLAIAQRFASQALTVIAQPNQGAAAARNKAFSLSKGDYVQWLDADDLLAPDKVALQMEVLAGCETKRTLLSSAWGHFFNRCETTKFSPTSLWIDLSPIDWLLRNLGEGVFMQTASWLASRELSEAAGPWDPRLLGDDDGEYFSRVVAICDGIRFVPQSKMFYRRVVSNRLSHVGLSDKKLEAHFLAMQLQIRNIRSLEDSTRVRSACLKFLQRYMIYFYPQRPDIVEKLEQCASDLGGHLEIPRLPWKYACIQKLFGWRSAKQVQTVYSECKLSLLSSWDAALSRLKI